MLTMTSHITTNWVATKGYFHGINAV